MAPQIPAVPGLSGLGRCPPGLLDASSPPQDFGSWFFALCSTGFYLWAPKPYFSLISDSLSLPGQPSPSKKKLKSLMFPLSSSFLVSLVPRCGYWGTLRTTWGGEEKAVVLYRENSTRRGCSLVNLPGNLVSGLPTDALPACGGWIYIYHVLTSCLEFPLSPSGSPSLIISPSLHFIESPLLFLTSTLAPQELFKGGPQAAGLCP